MTRRAEGVSVVGRGGPRTAVKQRDLTEKVPVAEGVDRLATPLDANGAGHDHEEVPFVAALVGQLFASRRVHLLGDPTDRLELVLLQAGEQWHAPQELQLLVHVPALLP